MIKSAKLLLVTLTFFLFLGCNSDDPNPGQVASSSIDPRVIDRTYSSITYNIEFPFSGVEVEDVFVAISDDPNLDVNDFYDRTLRLKDFSFTKLPFTGSQIEFKGTELSPETGYTFIFYHVSGKDTLVDTRSDFTAFLQPFGFEPRVIGSEGEINLIGLKVDQDDFDKLSFYIGDRELVITSSKQNLTDGESNRSFVLQAPEFNSYDSLKLLAKFNDHPLEGQYVEYGWNGTEIAPFYQEEFQYVIPSDWNYKSTLTQELSADRRAFFQNRIYTELDNKIYFYGNGSVSSETYGIYSFDLTNFKHELIIPHELSVISTNQTLVTEDQQLIRYRVAGDSIVKERVNLISKKYELVEDDVLENIEVTWGFFHKEYFFNYNSSSAKKYNLISGSETNLDMRDGFNNGAPIHDGMYSTSSFIVSKNLDQGSNFWNLTIYDIVNDKWTSTQYPSEAAANFTLFEYEGILGAGHVKKELYFFFPGSNNWKYLNDFQVSHHAGNDFIQTVPFYVSSSKRTIFLAGEGVYEFNPIGIDLIEIN